MVGRRSYKILPRVVHADRRQLLATEGLRGAEDLALALSNLSGFLATAGRRRESLAAAEEAVAIYEVLIQSDRQAFLPEIATALDTYANRLGEAGRHHDALRESSRAVAFHRELVRLNPDEHTPSLAGALGNYGIRQVMVGRNEPGIEALREAAELDRQLVRLNMTAHLEGLAGSLLNLGTRLVADGFDEGLDVAAEAIELWRELVDYRRKAHLLDYAGSLATFAVLLARAGRSSEGLSSMEESVRLREELATDDPGAFQYRLLRARQTYALYFAQHDLAQAVALATQNIANWRALIVSEPDSNLSEYASALGDYASVLALSGQKELAIATLEEAENTFQDLVDTENQYEPELAKCRALKGLLADDRAGGAG